MVALLGVAGCVQPMAQSTHPATADSHRDAVECLKAAIRYPHNPVVRVEAIEAFQSVTDASALPWIRSALLDEHPAVRFAACVAIGERRDTGAGAGIQQCLSDADASVRVGALFARHRLGRTDRTGELAGYLLEHKDPAVRRNAALVLGMLGEPGAVKVIAKAMKDADRGVRHHALEAMARLGNPEARQELTFLCNTGIGSEEVFAVNALAATRDPTYLDTFRYKLANARHLETRLAAGRALGQLGNDDGYGEAVKTLRAPRPVGGDVNDPPAGQVLRQQQLAALALGAIGRPAAVGPLRQVLAESPDPRVQVCAARAILDILRADEGKPQAVATTHPAGRGR
jgi:HEAT repeat protein